MHCIRHIFFPHKYLRTSLACKISRVQGLIALRRRLQRQNPKSFIFHPLREIIVLKPLKVLPRSSLPKKVHAGSYRIWTLQFLLRLCPTNLIPLAEILRVSSNWTKFHIRIHKGLAETANMYKLIVPPVWKLTPVLRNPREFQYSRRIFLFVFGSLRFFALKSHEILLGRGFEVHFIAASVKCAASKIRPM